MFILWLVMTEPAITSKAPSKYSACSISCNLKEKKKTSPVTERDLNTWDYMLGLQCTY